MKHWKLHLWLLINILLLSYFLTEPSVFRTSFILFIVVMLLSTFILNHEMKINDVFTKNFGFRKILSAIGFILFMLTTVRVSRHLNNPELKTTWATDKNIQYNLIGFMLFSIICYILLLRKRTQNEGEGSLVNQPSPNE
jgi:cellulose synthase/poly-beta-1,6-N-acetylglucosamine synthase-like glycosyltransferase